MGTWRFALNGLWRELRSGELVVLMAALVVAVGSITAISFLTDRIGKAVARQASEVLAADLRVGSGRELDPDWLARGEAAGLDIAQALNFPSVVFADDQRVLVNLKAVSTRYPLRGELRLAPKLFGTPAAARGAPPSGTAYADAAMLARLGVDAGDTIEVGRLTLEVDSVLVYRPDQSPGFTALAPTLLVNIRDIEASGLLAEGSRVRYTQLYAGSEADVAAFGAALREEDVEGVRIEDEAAAGTQLASAISRAGRFLSLASLVSLILAAVAVAMSARRYAERRLDSAALMKTFGAPQALVLRVGLVHLMAVGVVASLIGTALGFAAERGLSALLTGWLRGDLPQPGWEPALPGMITALVLMAGFALPSLFQLRDTPPLRVLRNDIAPPPPAAWLTWGLALATLALLVWWAVRDTTLLTVIIGGTVITAAVLYGAGRLLVGGLSRLRGNVGVSWRYGLANVARRGQNSAIQVVAFGLGLMVLLLLTLVRNDLLSGWRATVDESAPNQFLINIQPEERDSIGGIFSEAGLGDVVFTPLVRGRITAVNDTAADDWSSPAGEGTRRLGREINLSWSATLDPSNEVVDGQFWGADYSGAPQVSVDEDTAQELGVGIGDTLSFDFAGVPITAEITSLRRIDWDSFKPNFFMVLSPAGMAELPQTYITSLYIPETTNGVLLTLVREHPSVSVIDIEAALAQVRGIIDKASLAVQYVFLFTLAAGLVVLFAAIQSTLDERRYESALLRTFGATRGTILAGILAEFSALGLLAGACAATGATAIGIVAARELFDLELGVNPVLWFAGLVAGLVMVGASGTLAARSAADTPPVRTLRRG
ncbi:MAG: FtsX-like permease family protein [Pseudomonadota bacterium]